MEAPPPGGRGDDGLICRVGGPARMHDQLKHDPFSGTIYIFRSKRADRLKILACHGGV
jgi:hypothetical protein